MIIFSCPMGEHASNRRHRLEAPPLCHGTFYPCVLAAVDFTFLKTFVTDVVAQEFTSAEKCQVGGCSAQL